MDALPGVWADVPPVETHVIAGADIVPDLERRASAWSFTFATFDLAGLARFAAGLARAEANAWNEDAVLFFDEADAVFHRRAQTAAPWANRDVNVLLSRLEDFPGMVILATNLTTVLDRALDRRIDIPVEFDMPDAEMREEIYRKLMPRLAPLSGDVDFRELARRHRLAGGHILNVIRQAMRYAARRDGIRRIVTMDDLRSAAKREVAKAQVMNRNHLEEPDEAGPGRRVAYHG